MILKITIIGFIAFQIYGCQSTKEVNNYGFTEGLYRAKELHKKVIDVYLIPYSDSVEIFSIDQNNITKITTIPMSKIYFVVDTLTPAKTKYTFRKTSFDFDVMNIVAKARPSVQNFPAQFNSRILNGAIYVGYRNDYYFLKSKLLPLGRNKNEVKHFGMGFGAFAGLGTAEINPDATLNATVKEYNGFINTMGIAAIIAYNKINFGLNVGTDHLLDQQKKTWIYQAKPWIGFSVAFNLN